MSDLTPKEARELWAQALESGEYQQGDGQLTRVVDCEELDCCLGVACKLAIEHGVIAEYDGDDGELSAYRPVQEWLGLQGAEGEYRHGGSMLSLVADNDSGVTFPEIAETIRAEPEGLVVA